MQKITDSDSGIYLLLLKSSGSFDLLLPKFGNIKFRKGYYLYSGSAQKNLSSRIERHLRIEKKIFWHIDYLLSAENISVKKIYIYKNAPKSFECKIIRHLEKEEKYSHPVPYFGSSDCKSCKSHLLFFTKGLSQTFSVGKSKPVLFFEM